MFPSQDLNKSRRVEENPRWRALKHKCAGVKSRGPEQNALDVLFRKNRCKAEAGGESGIMRRYSSFGKDIGKYVCPQEKTPAVGAEEWQVICRGGGMLERTWENGEKGRRTTPSQMVHHWETTEKCAQSKE